MIRLGDVVRDTVTGFEGMAISEHTYLHGCRRISVQPQQLHEGKIVEALTFDEPQLLVVKSQPLQGKRDRGGPRNEPARPSAPSRR